MLTSKNIIEMETKIFVIEVPTFGSILDKIGELVGDVIPKVKENVSGCGARYPSKDEGPKTGDNTQIEVLALLALAAIAGVGYTTVRRKKEA